MTKTEQYTEFKIPNSDQSFRMIQVPGGSCWIGASKDPTKPNYDPDATDDEALHSVTLDAYWLAEYPVTQALWVALMGHNPARFNENDQQCPVETVSWYDAVVFCNRLSKATDRTPCYLDAQKQYFGINDKDKWLNEGNLDLNPLANGFRLPTEAQWEVAARGGSTISLDASHDFQYAGTDLLPQVGWYDENAGKTTMPVGLLMPNELGFFDLNGNVFEWCEDWYADYDLKNEKNPLGPPSGTLRVVRGGCWSSSQQFCRSAYRDCYTPDARSLNIGFRLSLQSV